MKSILHKKDGTCYLCRKLHHYSGQYSYTEEHHVFEGTANRKLSEKYGLKVYLCLFHHREGPEAVHMNKVNDLILKMDAQKEFEQTHSREEFMNIFGKNWLEEDPWEAPWLDRMEADGAAGANQERKDAAGANTESEDAAGFRFLPDEDALAGMGGRYLEIEKAAAARKLDDRQFRNLLEIAETLVGKEKIC